MRAKSLLLIATLAAILTIPASAFDFDYSCSKTFDDYYFGGEYLYFTCTIIPASSSDSKQADDTEYTFLTNLDSSAITVTVEFKDGKKHLHPAPDDDYEKINGTTLSFYIPETEDGIEEIDVAVSGYVPVIERRLENLSALKVTADDELFNLQITVVNKQKFYSDLKEFEKESCADEKKLREAKTLYNEGKYSEAEKLLAEVEEAINECRFKALKEKYDEEIDDLKSQLSKITTTLAFIQYRLDYDREKIENYDEMMEEWRNLTLQREQLDNEIDELVELVSKGQFSAADEKIESISSNLTSLKVRAETLKESINVKNTFEFDLVTLAIIAGGVAVIIVTVYTIVSIRRRDKW